MFEDVTSIVKPPEPPVEDRRPSPLFTTAFCLRLSDSEGSAIAVELLKPVELGEGTLEAVLFDADTALPYEAEA